VQLNHLLFNRRYKGSGSEEGQQRWQVERYNSEDPEFDMNLQGSDGGSSVEDKTTQSMEDVRTVRKAELDVIYYLPRIPRNLCRT
jgi:hypothetical protein